MRLAALVIHLFLVRVVGGDYDGDRDDQLVSLNLGTLPTGEFAQTRFLRLQNLWQSGGAICNLKLPLRHFHARRIPVRTLTHACL
jgi:hypothetical protein